MGVLGWGVPGEKPLPHGDPCPTGTPAPQAPCPTGCLPHGARLLSATAASPHPENQEETCHPSRDGSGEWTCRGAVGARIRPAHCVPSYRHGITLKCSRELTDVFEHRLLLRLVGEARRAAQLSTARDRGGPWRATPPTDTPPRMHPHAKLGACGPFALTFLHLRPACQPPGAHQLPVSMLRVPGASSGRGPRSTPVSAQLAHGGRRSGGRF